MADISGQKIDLGNAGMQTPMGLQFALPQTVQKVTKKSWSSQGTEYDKDKMQALRDALGLPRPKMTWQEALANTLSQAQNPQAFTGGFGEQFVDPFGIGFASLARGFGNTYGVRAANAREVAEKEREDAIKMAELENEAAKRTVSSQVMDDYVKFNDPNAKSSQQMQNVAENLRALYALKEENRKLAGDFDNAYTVKDENGNVDTDATLAKYRGASGSGRLWQNPNSVWGTFGVSKKEADARNKLATLRESQINNIYQSLKGAGNISETELKTMAKTASEAYNPYLLDLSIDNTIRNLEARYGLNQEPKYVIEEIQ